MHVLLYVRGVPFRVYSHVYMFLFAVRLGAFGFHVRAHRVEGMCVCWYLWTVVGST